MANCCCEIKITSKLAQTHQSIENSQSMLSEQKEVSKKRSGILLFQNKNNIKTCSNTSIDRKLNLLAMLVEEKWVSKKMCGKLLLWNKKKNINIYSNTSIDRKLNLLAMLVEEKWVSKKRSGKLLLWN